MAEWIRTLWAALTFDNAAFTRFRERRDAFLQGFLLIVIVALIVGVPALISDTVKGLKSPSVQAELDQATTQFENVIGQIEPLLQNFVPEPARSQALDQARQSFKMGLDIAAEVEKAPTMLPRPVTRLLEAVGRWLSRPFGGAGFPLAAAALGTWLGYGIWVMLFAKLLGGKGSLTGFFGTTALYAVPHLLRILSWVPFLGGLLALVAFAWGAAIYVKGTAVSHQLSFERALLAVILPLLILFVVLYVVITGTVGIIALTSR